MKKEQIKTWLSNWLSNRAGISADEVSRHLDDNYFDLGYIDSFGFIELLDAIETKYGIMFDNEQFEDRGFSTVSGMTEIILAALGQ